MDSFFVVDLKLEEKSELFSFFQRNGFEWMDKKELEDVGCFPVAVDTTEKCVGKTNDYFVKAYNISGGKTISASDFKKVVNQIGA